MKNREHHIDPLLNHIVPLKNQQSLTPNRGNSCRAVFGMILPPPLGQQGIVRAAEEEPVSLFCDSHRENVILFLVHIVQDGLRRAQGNLMLRADAAKENTYTEFFHAYLLNLQIIYKFPLEIQKDHAIIFQNLKPQEVCHAN